MLKTSHISNIQIYTDEWDRARRGRFTSSRFSCLMGEKPFTTGAMTYINHKVGEYMTNTSFIEDEVLEDENTHWGKEHEPAAIRKFGHIRGIQYLVTQKIIFDPDSRFSSTPDAIWIHGASALKENEYNVSTLEVKCPRKFHKYIPLYKCKTPSSLKAFNSQYYWQVIHQMYVCDAAVGYFACYHPLFPEGTNFNTIEFRKIDLWPDFKLMADRKKLVTEKFEEIFKEMKGGSL